MPNSYSGNHLTFKLMIYFAIVLVVGLAVGAVAWTLLLGCILLLLWHYHQLRRLTHWLWHDRRLTPPQASGSWEGIFNGIYRMQGKNRRRVSQLAALLGRFRQGAEALPDAAVVLDPHKNILWCNKLAQMILGLEWPQDSGQRIDNLVRHPDFRAYLQAQDFNEPLELVSPVSDKLLLEFRLMQYGDQQLLLIVRDITRIRQLEGMRKEFVANVSHELKTPLTVLQGYLEMMQSMTQPDDINARPLQLMQQQTRRMHSMVEQLLTLSRIEDTTEVNLEHRINMHLMLTAVKEEAEALSQGRHTLMFDFDVALDAHGNEVLLRSACSNLVSNAIRYTPQGGVIKVSWRKIATGGRFQVEDNGLGIAPQHLGRLTERFYRVDNSRSSATGGSGLGLAIVKHVLAHHHCELYVSSQLGKGSIFGFVLPHHLLVK